MSEQLKMSGRLSSLSAREQRLLAFAVTLALGVGLFYGVLSPGVSAARSAESRRAAAAAELVTARELTSAPAANAAPSDLSPLGGEAQAAGLSVITGQQDMLRIEADGPATLLAWLSSHSGRFALSSVVIEPTASGSVIAEIRSGGEQ